MKKLSLLLSLLLLSLALCVSAMADEVILHADVQKDGSVGYAFTIRPESKIESSLDGDFRIELTAKPFTPPAGMAAPAVSEDDEDGASSGMSFDFAASSGESAPRQLLINAITYAADGSITLNTEEFSTDNNFTISFVSTATGETLHAWTENDLTSTAYGAIDAFTTGVYEGTYQDADGNTVALSIVYALYIPENADDTTPMVITMHGSGESGADGIDHLNSNQLSSCWVEPAWQQEHPCYVFAPQWPDSSVSNDLELRDAYIQVYHDMFEAVKAQYQPAKTYLASLSMGSRISFRYLTLYPNYFDAAIMCCGALQNADPSALTEMPVWFVHAISDGTNLCQNSVDAFNRAADAGNRQVRLTLIPDDALNGASAHFAAWQTAYGDSTVYMEWLFQQ